MSAQEERWWFLCAQFLDITLPRETKRSLLRELKELVVYV
jgi:hypothetical protein